MENPLLKQDLLPNFNAILPRDIEPAVKEILAQNRAQLKTLLAKDSGYTWENLIAPLEEMDRRLNIMWSPVAHLHAVMETDELRAAYNACLPLLTEYQTEVMQNEKLYQAVQYIADSAEFQNLNAAQRKVIENDLRDFRLGGVSLSPDIKARFGELLKHLTKLTTQFSENILDATHAFHFPVNDLKDLAGLPEQTIQLAEQNAKRQNKTGWLLTLDFPCYSNVMKYLKNREIRRVIYEAYVTRASDQGPNAKQFDNSAIMEDIVKTRLELAQCVDFPTYADYSLATKMAKKPERVLSFLNDLVDRSKKFAQQEIQELQQFAKEKDHIDHLEAWDLSFYSEQLRQAKFDLSQQELRQYFPVSRVLSGMFSVMNKLFGITMVERFDVETWHPQVQFFEIHDMNNQLRGYFYTDLYAHPHKRDGAWMDDCRVRQHLPDKTLQYPVAFLTCNFTQPVDNHPALLTHEEVQTLFHEFGHCLHHLLTLVDYAPVSGINGVPWDAVEFPSQFFEHWCWDEKALDIISAHEKTGAPLPKTLLDKLMAAKNFQSGMHMLRQLEFALFDFRLHLEFDPKKGQQVQAVLDDVRHKISVVPTPKFNRFQHSFSHIFAGGYSAGYYSYKWAEVLSSDAFSRFEETGIFDRESGLAFLHDILEQGGVRDPMELFAAFRGREPSIDALLRHSGML